MPTGPQGKSGQPTQSAAPMSLARFLCWVKAVVIPFLDGGESAVQTHERARLYPYRSSVARLQKGYKCVAELGGR
jgi:hypothetical protein